MGRRRWTKDKATKFCEILRLSGNVSKAADAIGFNRTSLYRKRTNSDGNMTRFGEEWDDAYIDFWDRAESAALKAALEGIQEETYERGKDGAEVLVRRVLKRDNRLLAFLLKSRHPGFRETVRHEHTGVEDGAPIRTKDDSFDLSDLSDDEALQLRELLIKAGATPPEDVQE